MLIIACGQDHQRDQDQSLASDLDLLCARVGFLKLGLVKKLRVLGHLWTDLANLLWDL